MRRGFLVLLSLAVALAAPIPIHTQAQDEDRAELLVPGPPLERFITAEERPHFRVEVNEAAVLVLVEKQGIDLVVEAQGPAGQTQTASSPNHRWGPEVLLLSAPGVHRIELRSKESDQPGRFTITVETLTDTSPEESARRQAWALLSRAGQESFTGTPESRKKATNTYREAREAWRALEDQRWMAEAQLNVAASEEKATDLRAAIPSYEDAVALWRKLDDPRRLAATLDLLGGAQRSAGDLATARGHLEEAIDLWREMREPAEAQLTRNVLCLVDLSMGSLLSARACFEDLLAYHRDRRDRLGEAKILNSLGGVHEQMGEPDAALEHFGKALDLWETLDIPGQEATTLQNIGQVYRGLGEWQEALRVYFRAREVLTPVINASQEASLQNLIGYTYFSLGDPERARPYLEEALRLRRQNGEVRGEIYTLNSLGSTYRDLGSLDQAQSHHRQALQKSIDLKDPRLAALSRLGLGMALGEGADSQAALRELDAAIAHFRENGLRGREAQALQAQGRALAAAGRPEEALAKLNEVLARQQALHDRAGEAETLRALASVERSLGHLDTAQKHAEQAVAQVEELRTGFVSPDLSAAFLATRGRAYELAIELSMDRNAREPGKGHDLRAFELTEQARARTLLDVLQPGNSRRAGSVAPAAWIERRQDLRRSLSMKAAQLVVPQITSERSEVLAREMEELRAKLDGVEGEIRRHDPRYAAFSQPPTVGPKDIAELLDGASLFLEYSLGEQHSFLWVVNRSGLRSFSLPPRNEIEGLARRVYEDLSTVETGTSNPRQDAEALAKVLFSPVWKETTGLERLVIVPDGALHALPFGALPVPDPGLPWDGAGAHKPLLQHLEVVYIPSAATLAVERQRQEQRPPAQKWAVLLADPVFSLDDSRLTKAAALSHGDAVRGVQASSLLPSLERLPSTGREAEKIAALAPADQIWKAYAFDANRDAVLSGGLQGYRVVHFATHGFADTRNPELSGLVFSLLDASGQPRDGLVGLSDIYDLSLTADLVVLSGCRTALGKEVRGEGLMGLTRGFLYAGVPRVVGSLWPVQDRASAELMSRFYEGMWKRGLSPAAALHEAQRWLRSQPRYRDPYYWAGFVLQGDWRGGTTMPLTSR